MKNLLRRGRLVVLVGVAVVLAAGGGELLSVRDARAQVAAKKKSALVDVNTATAEQLQTLPGIGPAIAKAIIDGRPYSSVNDLERVKGLGATRLAELKGKVTASRAPAGGAAAKKKMTAAPKATGMVNVNTASAAELQELPGIGPVLARAIIDGRPYSSVEDLERVKGLGESRLEDLTDLVTTGNAPAATPRTATKPAATKKKAAPSQPKIKSTLPAGTRINVNTASQAELEELPLIGPVKAAAIIAGRPFKTVEDLKNVRGIGDKTFERIKDSVSVK
jgi:competence protein ComEA